MAQARRVRRTARRSGDAVLLQGSYCLEQKITVEWDRELALDELGGLLAPILARPRSFAEIRAHVSGVLKRHDATLPAGRISRYRVSRSSLRQALAAMVADGRLAVGERPGSHAPLWSASRR